MSYGHIAYFKQNYLQYELKCDNIKIQIKFEYIRLKL